MLEAEKHQYIERATGAIIEEKLFGDPVVRFLYSTLREKAPALFRQAVNSRSTNLLSYYNYDLPFVSNASRERFIRDLGIDLEESLLCLEQLTTPRAIFERKIRYWTTRPMPENDEIIVSPADSRILIGTLVKGGALFLKHKFFDLEELLGGRHWDQYFVEAEYAIFRLTPDKYHYNHSPVSGKVLDFFEVEGDFHSCNPTAVIAEATPYSKNRRTVTIIDTDVPGGTGVGVVAMIEVTALMIGEIVQSYSSCRYDSPVGITKGMFIRRGNPKSLFRPGSSTVVLLFEAGRVSFDKDLLANQIRPDIQSRFSKGLGGSVVETDVLVRSRIGEGIRQKE